MFSSKDLFLLDILLSTTNKYPQEIANVARQIDFSATQFVIVTRLKSGPEVNA